ncbi:MULTISPECIES: hypothetical protein [unclassified Streptomyces]|jgi:hypothetical protein|uniref:hypothetical protein n=1 Tax=unclassified Streptomyces TaxID=2593676 RepID=UPI0006CD1FAB|nr:MULTISPECIES: hypothetical protein [unclassified Streptomyces]KPI28045.1 hypothetical protein OV450_7327 [Actinobacteria bacterium OV450]WSR28927.1 hypothetical protein OG573_40705 [Streptomyces sp. NBC_01205]WSW02635.1 hypothetical protein OG509_41450 [Streptomyces sp. NBC_01006]
MALRDVLNNLNDTELVANPTEARLAGEGVIDPAKAAVLSNDEAYDAPMMVLSQINEA